MVLDVFALGGFACGFDHIGFYGASRDIGVVDAIGSITNLAFVIYLCVALGVITLHM
jgi:hypothetical protein